jgi:parallel beta-helix repeat protein
MFFMSSRVIEGLLRFKGIFVFVFLVLTVVSMLSCVSAVSLSVDEVGYGSSAVVNHTLDNGYKIPGYVKVNGKNSTSPSFLNTLTKTVVQVNQNVKTPVTISSVGAAPNPSGSATGTLTKSEYITNGQLPSTMNVLNIPGTTRGVNIQDTTRPTVTSIDPANNKVINVANKAIVITFSENIKAGSAFTSIKVTNPDGVKVDPLYKVINGKTLTLTRNGYYINGLTYTITLPTGSITDQSGNGITAFTSKFTVDFAKPTVTGVDPANNKVINGVNKALVITFSENIKAGSAFTSIKVTNPDGVKVNPLYKVINGKTLTLTRNGNYIDGLTYTITLPTGSIIDTAGNTLAAAFTSKFTVDNTKPTVTSVDPANNKVITVADKALVITFSENIKAGSAFTSIKVTNPDGVKVDPLYKVINGKTLTLTRNGYYINGLTYTITLPTGSITDTAGNTLAAAFTSKFTVDFAKPTVSGVDPANNKIINVANKALVITFSEAIKAGSAFTSIKVTNPDGVAVNPLYKVINGKTLTLTRNGNYINGLTYTITLPTGSITDTAGNGINTFTSKFTIDTTKPTVAGVDPANNKIINVANKALVITFSEAIKAGSAFTSIKVANSDGVAVNPLYKVINGKTLTLTRNGNYINGLTYTITLPTGSITDTAGNTLATAFTSKFTIDTIKPTVTANLASGVYNTAKSVILTAKDNLDTKPSIYYTTNGSTPTTSSTKYTAPISISKTTTLKFMAMDKAGNQAPIQTVHYIFSPVGNINTGKGYNKIQDAVNDSLTLNGHTIEVRSGTRTENIIINKKLTIKPASSGTVTIKALNSSKPIFTINKSGSGSLIHGFVISGALNSYGLLLDGCSNCTINNNTITDNYFGILTNTTKTTNNTIINNNITLNQELGIGTWNSDNCVIYGNTITYNGYGGMTIFDSNNCIIHTNLIMENFGPDTDYSSGILISGSNNIIIENNLIPKNIFGIYIDYCENCTVYGNLIAQGMVGIYTDYSSVDINFNRIAINLDYELINENGDVDATNNWWGSNSNPLNLGEIISENGYTDYNPWLVLSIDPTSSVNSGGNTSITADLTHNNLGENTSSLGHVIKGIPITFSTSYGTIKSPALTFNGQAAAILNLGTTASKTVTINAYLDSQTVSKQMVIAPGVAKLNITSSARDSSNNSINFTYNVPLNNSVTWISALWKNTSLFHGQLQVIVNGTVVNSKAYINPAYNTWKNSYRSVVFSAIIYANNYILQDGMDPESIPTSFWNDLTSTYGLTSTELQFIKNHRLEFIDNLTVKLTYPGVDAPNITVTDPGTNNTIDLNFTGNTIHRTSPIMYMDGISAGYEGVKSFAIATTEVNDDILDYWTDQNATYPVGAMKAAYGTFLTALLMEYIHDQVANEAANGFNVTWARTKPIAVSVGDDAYQTYLTLECDHSMGMTVVGALGDVWMFNYFCSSTISFIEYGVMDNIGYGQINTIDTSVNSVTLDLIDELIFYNASLEYFIQNSYIIYKAVGRDDNFMVMDLETGIMRDINTISGYYGAYCFHNELTNLTYGQTENFLVKKEYININSMIRFGVGLSKIYAGFNLIGRGIVALPFFPVGTAVGAVAIGVGGLTVINGAWQVKNSVYDGWTTNRSYEEQLNQDWHEWIHTLLL